MTQHPEKRLTLSDIPARVPGGNRYTLRYVPTGGVDIIEIPGGEGLARCVDHKPNEQSAIRAAIRLQKRANAKVLA